MRGWYGLSALLVTAASCYAPTALPGAPCTLDLDNCPSGQRCELVAGASVCVELGTRSDASAQDGSADGSAIDASAMIDAQHDPWKLVQHQGATGDDVNCAASAAGNLIVVAVETNASDPVTAVTDNVGNTYNRVKGSRAVITQENLGVEVWYAVNANPGTTRIVAAAPTVHGVVMWEVDGFGAADPLGDVAKVNDQVASMMPDGAAITTTTTGEFVVSILIVEFVITNIVAGSFTNDELVFGNGWAHLTSNTAPPGTYQAAWSATNGLSCASSVAFRVTP